MSNLSTKYLGLTLKSPLIVSSSGLTNSVDKIKKFEDLGAGAVVLKSLFEEQIKFESGALVEEGLSPEAHDYITRYSKADALDNYLKIIEGAKESTQIPVIASINCMSVTEWVSFAKDIENAGADALELNVFFIASDIGQSSEKYEGQYEELISRIRQVTKLPVSVKIGHYFTNMVSLVNRLYVRGAKGVVLFNRFYEPDIDIEKMEITSSGVFSTPADMRHTLRWVGIISDKVSKIDIAASTGVHDGKAVIKQILAGATAVQICSVLYEKGNDQVRIINSEIERWMQKKGFLTIDQFRGKLNYKNISNPSVYERSQFIKYFSTYQ
ncbi:MAG TPA: dihydroorotate dehydrogenase-like protein [Bacteroidales bacterium]|jgi:dihydroorotate dehydrogenase (fumarate)|nr:dihydroorotate dehydrogenase-like protein [Bacteroidales bacterium]